jgi:hypothetical protein
MKHMNKVVLTFLILIISVPGLAQPPTYDPCNMPARPRIPVQTFPIGGFDYGLDLSKIDLTKPPTTPPTGKRNILSDMITGGMNMFWFQGGGELVAKLAANTPPQMGIDYGEHKTYFESNYFSALDTRLCASERRYFVASNEMNAVAALTHSPPSLPTASNVPTDLSALDVDRLHYCQSDATKLVELTALTSGKIEYLNGVGGTTSKPLYEWHAQALIASTTPILVLDRTADFYHDYVKTSADQYNSWVDKSSTNFEYSNLICDFIYRLSPDDAALSGNLYEIDYTVYRGANTTTGSVALSNSDYDPANAIPDNANWTSGPHLGDKNEQQSNIINFPTHSSNRYAIRRIVIPITNGTGGYPTRITYSLKCINPLADIFVRGFRLRSELMNELENGYKDADLALMSTNMLTEIYTYGGCDALNNTSYLTAGGEIRTPDAFRSLAYIDNFLSKFTVGGYRSRANGVTYQFTPTFSCPHYLHRPMHIYTFLADGSSETGFGYQQAPGISLPAGGYFDAGALYAWYRSVYEDETHKLPPPAMEEGLDFTINGAPGRNGTDNNNSIPVPRDGIPYVLLDKRSSGVFRDFLMPITGAPDPKSSRSLWSHLGATEDNTPMFDTYLIKMQGMITYWNNTEFYASSAAAYPPYYGIGRTPFPEVGKWWGIVPAIMSFTAPFFQPGTSYWLQTDILSTIIENRQQSSLCRWSGNNISWVPSTTPLHNHGSTFEDIYASSSSQLSASHAALYNAWLSTFTGSPTATDIANENTWLDKIAYGGVYPLQTGRTTFASEMRMYAWDALSFGAKGIVFNPGGNDGGANIGITDARFNHDYDYDLSEPSDTHLEDENGNNGSFIHPPFFLTWMAPPLPISVTCTAGAPDRTKGYTDQLIRSSVTGHRRWIPVFDCATSDTIVSAFSSGYTHEELVSTYISNVITAGGTAYGQTDYYEHASTLATQWEEVDRGGVWRKYWSNPPGGTSSDSDDVAGNLLTALWPKAYEGFKEKWTGATTIASDIAPIANALHNANWMGSYDYRYLDSAGRLGEVQPMCPIDLSSIISYKVNQYGAPLMQSRGRYFYPHPFLQSGNYNLIDAQSNILDHLEDGPSGTLTTASNPADGHVDVTDAYSPANANRMFYQIGLFNPISPQTMMAKNVVVLNRRTWPLYYDFSLATPRVNKYDHSDPNVTTDGIANQLLGAVDARIFSFKLSTSFATSASGQYFVYDANRGIRQVGTRSTIFQMPLDPGEGAYLQFGALSLLTGGGSLYKNPCNPPPSIASNNSRHLSAFELDAVHSSYFETYSFQGVRVLAPKDTIDGVYRRIDGTPAEVLVDSLVNTCNPAIATNPDLNTIGLVYAIDSAGMYNSQSLIVFRLSHVGSPYNYGPRDTIAATPLFPGAHSAPAIAPSSRGNYWIAYRNGDVNGGVALIDSNGHIIATRAVTAGLMPHTQQLSVATVLHPATVFSHGYSPYHIALAIDTLYVSFIAGMPGYTQVYFVKVYQDQANPALLDTIGGLCLSANLPWCENINDQIHVTPERNVGVTWDGVSHTGAGPEGSPARVHRSVLIERTPLGRWTDYTTFLGFSELLDPGMLDTLSTYPVLSESDFDASSSSDTLWVDRVRLASTNPFEDLIHIAHFGTMAGHPIAPWELMHLTTPAQDPVMAARVKYSGVLSPLMFRFPKHIDTLADEIDLTSIDFPFGTEMDTATNVQTFSFHPVSSPLLSLSPSCPAYFVGNITNIFRKSPDTVYTALWHNSKPYYFDDPYVLAGPGTISQAQGDSTLVTTNFKLSIGDVLQYGRYFRVGTYDVGDTTEAINQLLAGSLDTLGMLVVLRDAANGNLLQVLDAAQLTSHGFTQTGFLSDSGQVFDTLHTSYTDSVYVSFETSHTSSSTAQLTHIESFTSSVQDVTPFQRFGTDTSYKQLPPGPSSAFASQLVVSAYPNPFKNSTTVNVSNISGLHTTVLLYDLLGNIVKRYYDGVTSNNSLSLTVDGSTLVTGAYFIRVASGNSVTTKRLMIMK